MNNPTNFIIIDDGRISALITELAIKDIFNTAVTTTFINPLEGVDFIKNEFALNPINTALFLDLNMPMVNGWEVIAMLEALPKTITQYLTIFLLSSSIDPMDKLKAKKTKSITEYLDKPISIHTLQRILHKPK